MKIAAVTWKIRPAQTEEAFLDHLEEILGLAEGADLIVLPELVVLELCATYQSLSEKQQIERLAAFGPRYEAELIRHSARLGATLVGGSHFRPDRSHGVGIAFPDGAFRFQGKQVLTQFELVDWGLKPLKGLVSLPNPQLGTLVCYDSEFPEAGRAWAERGALVLAVPAYTETRHGFHRVRTGCAARALENQIIVVHASLVGGLGVEPIVSSTGSSAILAPSIQPFPAGGVLAATPFDEESVARADVDLSEVLGAREQGDVRNWNDRLAATWQFS